MLHTPANSSPSCKSQLTTPMTAATVAMTPSPSMTNVTPDTTGYLGDSSPGRALFRDSTPPRAIFRDASPLTASSHAIARSDSLPATLRDPSQRSMEINPAQRRRPRKPATPPNSSQVHFGIERRKSFSRRPQSQYPSFHSTIKVPTVASTPLTSSSSDDDSSPDRSSFRRLPSKPLPEIDKTMAISLCHRLSRINVNGLVFLLCIFAIISFAWMCKTFPQLSRLQDSQMAASRYEFFQEVKAPSAGGLRGKMVQMAGRKEYWKQRDAHARHQGPPKDRKSGSSTNARKNRDTKDITKKHEFIKTGKKNVKPNRALKFTPSPVATLKPSFDAWDAAFFPDSKKNDHTPRVVSFGSTEFHSTTVDVYPAEFTDNTQYYGLFDSEDGRLSQMEVRDPYETDQCVPMQDWQTTYHPWCNGMHELSLESMGIQAEDDAHLFGTKGYWRNAWRLDLLGGQHHPGDREKIVLKTLKFQHNFEDAHFEHDRVDAVAMERLTSSPHVINIFGFCGHSVMTEFADGTCVGELADKSRKTKLARLRIARDIANGLADVHGIDGDGNATFVHLDINPANVVSVGGTLKLNDFNIGIILKWNTTSNKQCGFPAQYPNPQWRSPEEARGEQFLTEKVDVFSMGHIFFRLICGHEPWNKLEIGGKPSKEEIHEKVQRGILPFIPDHVLNTLNPEVAAIRQAMLQCYTFNPVERPSARAIANELEVALEKLTIEYATVSPPT